jgi:hypothetical protein
MTLESALPAQARRRKAPGVAVHWLRVAALVFNITIWGLVIYALTSLVHALR